MVSCLLNLKMAQWMCLWPGKMVSTFSHTKVCTSAIGYTILNIFIFTMPKLHPPVLALSSTLLPVHNVTSFPLPSASRLSSLCLPFFPSLFPSFLPSPFLTSWFYFSPETHSCSENKMLLKFLDSHVLWEFGYTQCYGFFLSILYVQKLKVITSVLSPFPFRLIMRKMNVLFAGQNWPAQTSIPSWLRATVLDRLSYFQGMSHWGSQKMAAAAWTLMPKPSSMMSLSRSWWITKGKVRIFHVGLLFRLFVCFWLCVCWGRGGGGGGRGGGLFFSSSFFLFFSFWSLSQVGLN